MRFRAWIAGASLCLCAQSARALSPGDRTLAGVYLVKASIPIGLTSLASHDIYRGDWEPWYKRPFTQESFPFNAQILGITLPDLYVLGSLAAGTRGNTLQDRRYLACGIEFGSALITLGYAIYLGKIYGSGHGAEIVFFTGVAYMVTAVLAIPTLIPFSAESGPDTPHNPPADGALLPSEPVATLRISF